MAYTREQWAVGFLHAIGNTNPSQNTINWVVNWTQAETLTGKGASYNLLNTTQGLSGSTQFNNIGVQNYTSFAQGIQANASTIKNGLYGALYNALLTNNERALGYGGSPSSQVMLNLSTWCGGCGYGNAFVKGGGAHLNDSFGGTPSGATNPYPSGLATWLNKWGSQQGFGQNGEQGVDYSVPYGTSVPALFGGKVLFAGRTQWSNTPGDSSGGLVAIQTNVAGLGNQIYYILHLDSVNVTAGQNINPGTIVGKSGGQTSGGAWPASTKYSTGPHIEEGFNASFLTVNTGIHAEPPNFNPTKYLTNPQNYQGGAPQPTNTTGGSGLIDLSGLTNSINALPGNIIKDVFGSDIVQRFMLMSIALTIILVGVIVLFFSSGAAGETAKAAGTAAKVAAV
jgi:murein DD-endopeptidase MepM/ murein hydrolase activator NlpD